MGTLPPSATVARGARRSIVLLMLLSLSLLMAYPSFRIVKASSLMPRNTLRATLSKVKHVQAVRPGRNSARRTPGSCWIEPLRFS
jgi:hypothetical protein